MILRGRNSISITVLACMLIACSTAHINTSDTVAKPDGPPVITYHPFESEQDLAVLLKEIGDARIVLLGESTHGTSEYYEWRAAITKKLITEKGFDFVAVEGDWTDLYKVNEFIQGTVRDSSAAVEILKQYDRWPQSIWSNYEMASLTTWLNSYNQARESNKIAFYGLDLYSFSKWTNEKLPVADSSIQRAAHELHQKFLRFNNDALLYTDAVRHSKIDYRESAENFWKAVENFSSKHVEDSSTFWLQQHALLALEGERYFRTMVTDRQRSWNIRDGYMAQTIKRLLQLHGKNSKAIIWVHNAHAGDAHYSNMGSYGYTSVGEILRKEFGRKVFSTGFGTNKGFVMAGYSWNAPVQEQVVLPAKAGSWESVLHELSPENKLILSKEIRNNSSLTKWIEFRSIGAAYSGAAVYGTSIIPQRFDAFVFIDSTTAVHPIKK